MGENSLIRATLLVALLAAVGFVAAGRAPAAESLTAFEQPGGTSNGAVSGAGR